MSTKNQIVLLTIIALMLGFGFAGVQYARQLESRVVLLEARPIVIPPLAPEAKAASAPQTEGKMTYEFTCGEPGSGTKTELYKVYSGGKRELVESGIEHPGDCLNVVSSDAADRYAEATKLFLVDTAYGDGGNDGFFEYDLAKKTLTRSKIAYPGTFTYSAISEDRRYMLAFIPADSQDEVRSLELIDFQKGTTSTVAELPSQYSYVQSKHENLLVGEVDVRGEMDLKSWNAEVSVYSVKDAFPACGLSDAESDPTKNFMSCKERMPVFKLELNPSNPEKSVK